MRLPFTGDMFLGHLISTAKVTTLANEILLLPPNPSPQKTQVRSAHSLPGSWQPPKDH